MNSEWWCEWNSTVMTILISLMTISLRNHQLFPKFSISVGSKQRATTTLLNTLLVPRIFRCCFAQLPAPSWQTPQHTYLYQVILTLFVTLFLCVSHSNLLFDFCSVPNLPHLHQFVHPLPYSGFQFLFFLGQVPIKPLDFANFFRTCKHDSWWFDLTCHRSSNCPG